MIPERKQVIEGVKVEEFYWAGRQVVYVDNRLTDESFDEACKRIQLEAGQRHLDDLEMPGGFN